MMKKIVVFAIVMVMVAVGSVFAGEAVSLKFQVSAEGRDITYVPLTFGGVQMEAGKPDSKVVIDQPLLLPKQVKVKPGSYALSFTLKDAKTGQYLTGAGKFVQKGWKYQVDILDSEGKSLLLLDQDSPWVWEDNGLGGGNLLIKFKVEDDGTLTVIIK